MIQSTELRSGNIVIDPNPLSIPREGVKSDGYLHLSAYGIYLIEDGKLKYDPAPLTEEWLIKFGFEKNYDIPFGEFEYSKTIREGDLDKEIGAIIISVSCDFNVYNGIYTQKVKYVHKLQNLYFALTEKELTIKN